MKITRRILIVFLSVVLSFVAVQSAFADELEEISKKIDELTRAREMSEAATRPLEAQLSTLEKKIGEIEAGLLRVEKSIKQKEGELVHLETSISESEKDLSLQKELLAKTVRGFYIRSRLNLPLLTILAAQDVSAITRELAYQNAVARQDKDLILSLSNEILDLKGKKETAQKLKEQLSRDKGQLATLRAKIDKEAEFYRKEVAGAKKFQATLSVEIGNLTARQQEILGVKFGTFTTSVGDVPLPDDPNASPTFNPGFSPAFGGFSFGAFTHRNGMSQYGAKGRADQGQSAEDILRAYYPGSSLNKNYSVPGSITVSGYGSMAFEDVYMKRIYEMPNSFPRESLKAQAVAARTFAIRYTAGGTKPICPTESCQVYKNSNKGGAWEEAVNATRGWVLEGGPSTQYSSTTGGYLNTSGWDTKCGSKSCWTPQAYEKLAASPWFYKGWYTKSYLVSSGTCGRSHPWLKEEEFADILNSWRVYQNGNDEDRRHISPVDTVCWGGDPYSISRMRERAQGLGGAYSSVSSVSVVYREDGQTASVSLSTNQGALTISGQDFKTIFNLRAPGYIAIRSALYNIEKK